MILKRLIEPRTLIYLLAVLVLSAGVTFQTLQAQGGTWQSCYQTWFGLFMGPPECGSPPAGSECYPGCAGPFVNWCPADYCWSVFVPDPPSCPNAGQACTSAANSCGMQASGTIDSGTCSCTATTPSDTLCPAPTCANGSPGPYPGCPLPTCAGLGLLGTYPDCYAAPPPPTCADTGQLGTYPNCYDPEPDCVPSAACAATTCQGQVCYDSCANAYAGSLVCAPVDPGDPNPTVSLTASPTTISPGGSSTLRWSSSDATSCTGGGFSTGGATNNATGVVVSPASTATYTINCTGPGGGATDDATVTVTGGACSGTGPLTLTASPSRVQPGDNSELTWSGENVSSASCTIRNMNTNTVLETVPVTSCGVGTQQTPISDIDAQTTFRLTCGSLTKDVTINIVPRYEEF